MVSLCVIRVVVDAENDRDVGIGGGCRDHDLLRAGIQVLLRAVSLGEEAGRFEHDVDAQVTPGDRTGVAFGEQLDLLPTRADDAVARLDGAVDRAERRVVLEQVRHRRLVAEVVRCDDLDVRLAVELRPEEVPSDPAEAVDAHTNRHSFPPPAPSPLPGRV